MLTTLWTNEQLRTEIRERTDYRGDEGSASYLDNDWLDREIERAVIKLWDFLYHVFDEDFYHKTATLTTVADQREYTLPVDFWRLKRVSASLDGGQQDYPFKRLSLGSSVLHDNSYPWVQGSGIRYYLNMSPNGGGWVTGEVTDSVIGFDPKPSGVHTVNVRYVPSPVSFSAPNSDAGKMWQLFGYEDFVVLTVSIKVRSKAEDDNGDLKDELAELKAHIQNDVPPKDVAGPSYLADERSTEGNAPERELRFFDRYG